MHYLRWYATSTTLPDGRVLATSGDAPDGTRATEPGDLRPGREHLDGAHRRTPDAGPVPADVRAAERQDLESGSRRATALLDDAGDRQLGPGPTNAYGTSGYSESAVMLSPGVILRAGGGDPASTRRPSST